VPHKCNGCGAIVKARALACEYCGIEFAVAHQPPPRVAPPLPQIRVVVAQRSIWSSYLAFRAKIILGAFVFLFLMTFLRLLIRPPQANPAMPRAMRASAVDSPGALKPQPRLHKPFGQDAVDTTPDASGMAHGKTPMLGATTGGGTFQIAGPGGKEPVIGFRIKMAQWDGKSIVRQLQPIYASDNCIATTSMTVAREGYAVGGVIVDGDDQVTAMRIIFMRLQGNALLTQDSYQSDWFGQPTGDPTHVLGANGQLVTGIYGRKGMNFAALGLLTYGKPAN
jgi:hypothetical protein